MKQSIATLALAPLIATLVLVGCSAPNTLPEFRSWARTSSHMKSKEYTVESLSLGSAEDKLRAFANKCMQKEVRASSSAAGLQSAGNYRTVSVYRPKVIKEKNRVTLVVQREDMNSVGYPDGGAFEFLAEVTPAQAKGVKVFTSTFALRMPVRILDDVHSWLSGEGQFCPF